MPARISRPQLASSGAAWRLRNAATRLSVRNLFRQCGGVTAIEYGIVAGLVALVIVSAVNALGNAALTQLFERIASSM